jgi:DNA-binding GntR family transcriptional regulator
MVRADESEDASATVVDGSGAAERAPAAGTLATSVYDRLRADILSGALDPGGKLRVEFVRGRYGVGNSPVREALNRLSADGLVERQEQRGFFVAPVSREDLIELTTTRCWLEEVALRQSIANRTAAWEEGIVLAYHRLSRTQRSIDAEVYRVNPDWEARHRAFHHSLIAACGSRWLLGFCAQLGDWAYRYRQLAVASVFPKRNERDEHERIMAATVDGDADAAARLLAAHYQKTADIILARPSVLVAEHPGVEGTEPVGPSRA